MSFTEIKFLNFIFKRFIPKTTFMFILYTWKRKRQSYSIFKKQAKVISSKLRSCGLKRNVYTQKDGFLATIGFLTPGSHINCYERRTRRNNSKINEED